MPNYCPPGQYSVAGVGACTPCSAGSFTTQPGQMVCQYALQLDSVFGLMRDRRTCTAGYYCPVTGITEPIACPLGMYSSAGSMYCTACPQGTVDLGATKGDVAVACTPCPAGKTTTSIGTFGSIATQCVPCTAGYYCAGSGVPPTVCSAQKVSDTGASTCLQGKSAPVPNCFITILVQHFTVPLAGASKMACVCMSGPAPLTTTRPPMRAIAWARA